MIYDAGPALGRTVIANELHDQNRNLASKGFRRDFLFIFLLHVCYYLFLLVCVCNSLTLVLSPQSALEGFKCQRMQSKRALTRLSNHGPSLLAITEPSC